MDTQSLVEEGKLLKSTQLFIIAGTVLMTMVVSIMCIGLTVRYEVVTDTADSESVAYWKEYLPPAQAVWFERGAEELRLATKRRKLPNEVKNVIIFIADGIASDMVAKARFSKKGNFTNFVWDAFPYVATLKTTCGLAEPCDFATVGTSLFGGVKTTPGLLGLDKRVPLQNCAQAIDENYHVKSIFQQAQKSQIRTGIATTQRVTGPLLSSLYAHSSDTKWECDEAIPQNLYLESDCVDVATQLVFGRTGQGINVIMGGGRQTLVSRLTNDSDYDPLACNSIDKRNLLQDWKYLKLESNEKFELLQTPKELQKLNGTRRDFVLGVFSNTNLQPEGPKLKTMLMKTLDVLMRNTTGYLAVVEAGVNNTDSLLEFEDAIKATTDHPGFAPQTTLMLVAFMNLHKSAGSENSLPEDIRLFATGPNAHLFHRVHEETYLAHAISYALKIGPFASKESKVH